MALTPYNAGWTSASTSGSANYAQIITSIGNGTPRKAPSVSDYTGPELAVPDSIEPITAWREWKHDGTGLLYPLNAREEPWTPRRPLVATCNRNHGREREGRDEYRLLRELAEQAGVPLPKKPDKTFENLTPVKGCQCGIYAKKAPITTTNNVVGQVKMWGKVIVGSKGYRAQFAYPLKVWVIMPDNATEPDLSLPYRRLAQRIGRLYQCEVECKLYQDYLDCINAALVEHYFGALKADDSPVPYDQDDEEYEDDDDAF